MVRTRQAAAPWSVPVWLLPPLLFLPLAAWFDAARRALDAAGGERTAGLSEGALVGATLALVM
ncbi:MAG: hypothetical protein IT348_02060, partial [Candidatus Eisenbacteria bacterium]|nr:hypothetical protein [Candidatus Eisenbacteria bacterium]